MPRQSSLGRSPKLLDHEWIDESESEAEAARRISEWSSTVSSRKGIILHGHRWRKDRNEPGSDTGVTGSQFFITMTDHLDYFDGRYTVFGKVAEGMAFWKVSMGLTSLQVPDESPLPTQAMLDAVRIGDDEEIGSLLPPKENENIRRLGGAGSCIDFGDVIRDKKTSDSLCYAFIESEKEEEYSEAYFKMNKVLIDERRIHVDFSQSVSKLHKDWMVKKIGAKKDSVAADLNLQQRCRYRDDNSLGWKQGSGYDYFFKESSRSSRKESRRDDRDRDSRDNYGDRDRDSGRRHEQKSSQLGDPSRVPTETVRSRRSGS
ncbi:hypothetical protein EMPS_07424 [Entomortierella parvispora]|uniref:Peptidyl-prolyl cis-trans isomerase n=1 Tax=Entomortierella parvispora TaxID=205924 RepID=A0A9P3HE46_9FUNG|nr:hypothetical protein EMPS_07424 [Entomortierella parvispora]